MELSLDLSLNYVPKTISSLLNEVSRSKDKAEKHAVIDDYLKRLEEEMKKIEAFKRELPLCMLLLSDAIERLKEELRKCNSDTQTQPLMSELFPSMQNFDGDEAAKLTGTCSEKRNWMSSAQLWSPNLDCRGEEEDRSVPQNPIQQHRNRGGAFVPFKANCGSARKDNKEGSPVPSLSLMTPVSDLNSCDSARNNGTRGSGGSIFFPEQMKVQSRTNQQQQQQAFRKQRRCWSSELHRRFVEALQQLGGSHAATPKQIRELMQVDGLTNDEVKSHLQKYRLHVRRLPASSAAAANGVWMPHDHRGDHPKANISQSNSPQGPLPTSGSGKGISSTGDDSLDTEEDERSEVRSWRVGLH